jgi:hypothetical protein
MISGFRLKPAGSWIAVGIFLGYATAVRTVGQLGGCMREEALFGAKGAPCIQFGGDGGWYVYAGQPI